MLIDWLIFELLKNPTWAVSGTELDGEVVWAKWRCLTSKSSKDGANRKSTHQWAAVKRSSGAINEAPQIPVDVSSFVKNRYAPWFKAPPPMTRFRGCKRYVENFEREKQTWKSWNLSKIWLTVLDFRNAKVLPSMAAIKTTLVNISLFVLGSLRVVVNVLWCRCAMNEMRMRKDDRHLFRKIVWFLSFEPPLVAS